MTHIIYSCNVFQKHKTMRFNGYAIRALREEFRESPELSTSLDCIFGATSSNDYGALSNPYQRSHRKPDKHFSTLPTVLQLVGDCEGKKVLDLGCGSGFYTVELANLAAKQVIGIDNSQAQLDKALEIKHPAIEYVLGDIFTDSLPKADFIVAPYVINYAKSVAQLQNLFQKFFDSLENNGKIVIVVDLPSCTDLKRFGAVKTALGPKEDGTRIRIDLYDEENVHICALYATYFLEETIVSLLEEIGFIDVEWHTPIISNQGFEEYGTEFWEEYTADPQLGYLTAIKP